MMAGLRVAVASGDMDGQVVLGKSNSNSDLEGSWLRSDVLMATLSIEIAVDRGRMGRRSGGQSKVSGSC